MEFIELAKQRKSIRSYSTQPIPDEIIKKILEAGIAAPSAGNCQPWHFYVIKDRKIIEEIYNRVYNINWILQSQVIFVVCQVADRSMPRYGERGRDLYSIQDTAAAIQNMLMCAEDNGIGMCWCGAFHEPTLAEIVGVEPNHRPIAFIPAGYPENVSPNRTSRRPITEVVTYK